MAIKKSSKDSPTIFSGTDNPNTAAIIPNKIGDIYVHTSLSTLYFCKGLTGSEKWGTAGTA